LIPDTAIVWSTEPISFEPPDSMPSVSNVTYDALGDMPYENRVNWVQGFHISFTIILIFKNS
jgi:hypothetical protein